MPVLTADQLREVGIRIFSALGASIEEAETVTEFLVRSNLAGHDSHGVIRIPGIARGIQRGHVVSGAVLEIVQETPSTALIDGHWGFGQVIGVKAMTLAIEKAHTSGVGIIGVYNSNSLYRLAEFALLATEQNMIGIVTVNSVPLVAPYGGVNRLLSPAPVSYAFPTGPTNPSFALDMSTSVCAEGKIRVALHRDETVPDGWIIDKHGNPSNAPSDFYDGGAILPLGGNLGYKGFGLILVNEILAGMLSTSGLAYAPHKRGNGVFMEAINIANFMPIDQFKQEMDEMIQTLKKCKAAPGVKEIMIPGEPEYRTTRQRLEEGIDIPEKTWADITTLAQTLHIDVPG